MTVIETFLLKKINAAIVGRESHADEVAADGETNSSAHGETKPSSGLSCKLSDNLKKRIEDLIGENNGVEFHSLHSLYNLNNAIAEWQDCKFTAKTWFKVRDPRESLQKTIEELERSCKECYCARSLPEELGTYRWSSSSVDPERIHGIEDKSMIMERLLLEEEEYFKAIGIVGIAGVGKTALSQVAFSNEHVKEHFFPRIWVCLSNRPEDNEDYRKVVMKSMLMCLGYEEDIIPKLGGLRTLLVAVRRQLKGKRYLIVFDDVRVDGHEFFKSLTQDVNERKQGQQERLAFGLPKGHGGTVIVTSRFGELAKDMVGEKKVRSLLPLATVTSRFGERAGEKKVQSLLPLPEEKSCWKIFMDAVPEDKLPQHMDMLKDEIVKKCAGLPLLAKAMAKTVRKNLADPKGNHQNQTQPEKAEK